MRNPVDADGGRPIFYQRDVVFQRIAVDSSENSVLIYLATSKLKSSYVKTVRTKLLSVYIVRTRL